MLKLKNNPMREPLGGYRYVEGDYVIRGDNLAEVVRRLSEYRISNGKPVGYPMKDVTLYMLSYAPHLLVEDGKKESVKKENKNYLDWRDWVRQTWNNPPLKHLTPKESSERLSKCLDCPMNLSKDWPMTREADETEKRAFLLKSGLATPDKIGFCGCHRFDTAVASFFPTPVAYSNRLNEEKPEACWV